MRGDLARLAQVLIVLVVSAGAEELLPVLSGAGVPLLLAAAIVFAPRLTVFEGVATAVAAGAFEEALAGLPPLTAICFFTIAALLSRKEYLPRAVAVFAFPLFVLWTGCCVPGPMGAAFGTMFLSLPLGMAALVAMRFAVGWSERRAGLDG